MNPYGSPLSLVQPVPVGADVATAQDPTGATLVVLRFEHPSGSNVFFLDPTSATQFAEAVMKAAGGSHLVVPQVDLSRLNLNGEGRS